MRENEYKRNCPECYKEFMASRADQTYCCTKCRYDFHNRISRDKRSKVMPLDTILHKNREVLMALYSNHDPAIVSRQQLLDKGFDFSYHTHSLQDSNTKVKFDFVYEYGINSLGNNNYKIVKNAKV